MKAITFIDHPKKVSFNGEDPGEEILLLLRRHVITNLKWVLILIFILVAPTLLNVLFYAADINLLNVLKVQYIILGLSFWYLFAFGFALVNFLNWYFNVYIVTDKRVVDIDFHGILYRDVSEAPLRNIEDVTNKISGVFQMLFNYGDVHIQTAAEMREFDFTAVPRPGKVQDIISDLVSIKKFGPGGHGGHSVPLDRS